MEVIGFESEGTAASDRARIEPIIHGLAQLGYRAKRVSPDELVDVRVVNRLIPGRRWGNEQFRVLNISDNVLFPPKRDLIHDTYFAGWVRPRMLRALKRFDLVVAASDIQVEIFGRFVPAIKIPDVAIYLPGFEAAVRTRGGSESPLIFVWDGQGHNVPKIEKLLADHRSFFTRPDVRVHVITDEWDPTLNRSNRDRLARLELNVEFITWRRETFIEEVGRGHVGLAPIDMGCQFASAKPDNKPVNYVSLGLVALCSATRAYSALASVCPGVFVCRDDLAWETELERCAAERVRLTDLAHEGQKYVAQHYSQEMLSIAWSRALAELCAESGKSSNRQQGNRSSGTLLNVRRH